MFARRVCVKLIKTTAVRVVVGDILERPNEEYILAIYLTERGQCPGHTSVVGQVKGMRALHLEGGYHLLHFSQEKRRSTEQC